MLLPAKRPWLERNCSAAASDSATFARSTSIWVLSQAVASLVCSSLASRCQLIYASASLLAASAASGESPEVYSTAITLDFVSWNTERCSAKAVAAFSSSDFGDPRPSPIRFRNRLRRLTPASLANSGLLVRSSAFTTSTARSREVSTCTWLCTACSSSATTCWSRPWSDSGLVNADSSFWMRMRASEVKSGRIIDKPTKVTIPARMARPAIQPLARQTARPSVAKSISSVTGRCLCDFVN